VLFEFFPLFPWPWKKPKKKRWKNRKKTVFFQAFKTLIVILAQEEMFPMVEKFLTVRMFFMIEISPLMTMFSTTNSFSF